MVSGSRGPRHDDGLRKQVLCGVDGLAVRVVQTNQARIHNPKQRQDASDIKDLIKILFNHMEMEQEFTISGNSPFCDWHLA